MSSGTEAGVSRVGREMPPFLVMDVLDRARALQREGRSVIHMEVGEPDFDTPEVVREAGIRASRDGHTHYTSSLGRPELREALLEVVKRARHLEPPEPLRPRSADLDRSLRPVVSLVTSWVSQVARDADLDPAALATRSDVESFLTEGVSSRLDDGWRNELIGGPIQSLVRGEAAIAFDGSGGLVLEQRSGEIL